MRWLMIFDNLNMSTCERIAGLKPFYKRTSMRSRLVASRCPGNTCGTSWLRKCPILHKCLTRIAHRPLVTRRVSEDGRTTCLANASGYLQARCQASSGAGAQCGLTQVRESAGVFANVRRRTDRNSNGDGPPAGERRRSEDLLS